MTSPAPDEPADFIEAVLARLRATVDPVYDGHVPVDSQGRPLVQRYAVLWAAPGQRTSEDLAGTADRHVRRWQVTSVGKDRHQVEWVADRCRDALLDTPLVVEGWEIGTVEHTSAAPIRKDPDIPGAEVFFGADTYEVPATH